MRKRWSSLARRGISAATRNAARQREAALAEVQRDCKAMRFAHITNAGELAVALEHPSISPEIQGFVRHAMRTQGTTAGRLGSVAKSLETVGTLLGPANTASEQDWGVALLQADLASLILQMVFHEDPDVSAKASDLIPAWLFLAQQLELVDGRKTLGLWELATVPELPEWEMSEPVAAFNATEFVSVPDSSAVDSETVTPMEPSRVEPPWQAGPTLVPPLQDPAETDPGTMEFSPLGVPPRDNPPEGDHHEEDGGLTGLSALESSGNAIPMGGGPEPGSNAWKFELPGPGFPDREG